MNTEPLSDHQKITNNKNIKIKILKYFLLLVLFFTLFFTGIFLMDIYAISFDSKFGNIDNYYIKIPATVIPENPLRKEASDFVKPRKDFTGKADELNKIIGNIDKCLDKKFDFDEHTKTRLWKNYSGLLQNLDLLSTKPPMAEEKPAIKIPELFFTGNLKIFNISTFILRVKMSAFLALIAIEKKDYPMALCIDAALMRLSRAVAVANFNQPGLLGVIFQYETARLAAKGPARVYLECNEALREHQNMVLVKAALKSRVESLPLFYNVRDALKLEAALIHARFSVIRSKFSTTMKILDLWYEKPEAFFNGLIKAIDEVPDEQGAKLTKTAKEYFRRYTEFGEPGLKRFLKIHPLFYQTGFPDFTKLITNSVKSDAHNRLTTLCGLARVYYYENGSWPALEQNGEFLAAAGKAAIDPADAGLMRSKRMPGGLFCYYSIGPDGIDNDGNENEDVVIFIKPPATKLK